jgi:hypothetical protein
MDRPWANSTIARTVECEFLSVITFRTKLPSICGSRVRL